MTSRQKLILKVAKRLSDIDVHPTKIPVPMADSFLQGDVLIVAHRIKGGTDVYYMPSTDRNIEELYQPTKVTK